MTEDFQSPSSHERAQDDPAHDHDKVRHDDKVQTLTDLFDQLDRAAFKRALAHRDVDTSGGVAPKARNG